MTDVYMTVQGRSTDTTNAIVDSNAKLGVESSHDWIRDHTPEFVDYPFTDPESDFTDHLEIVRMTTPEVAVAPDIERGRTLDGVVKQADQLAEYATTVVVVPKSVKPSHVPSRFRVGVPAASFGSGAPWSIWEYRDVGPVHILGGGPRRQLDLREYVDVASVDTATLGKCCRFGYWAGVSKDAPEAWDYERRLRESLNNYYGVWN